MVKLFLDGPNFEEMQRFPSVHGYTTNPSLMKKLGIVDYNTYIPAVLAHANGKPVSFEVLADDFFTMAIQAHILANFDASIYVKIPITNTEGTSSIPLIRDLSQTIKLNVTAVMTMTQVSEACRALDPRTPAILSIFAGRVADTGRSVEGLFTKARAAKHAKTEVLWASTREVYSVKEAERLCEIITLSPELYKKMSLFGKDLEAYSLETVKQFFNDGQGIEL